MRRSTLRVTLCRPLLAALIVAAGVTGGSAALADAVYPSAHIPLHPVADAPLVTGFVENVHANGPNVFAHELYVVVGAIPDADLDVTISVFVGDPTCGGTPIAVPTATLHTNAAGNARADVVFTPEDAAGLRNATHGAIWKLSSGGTALYATDCTTIVLD